MPVPEIVEADVRVCLGAAAQPHTPAVCPALCSPEKLQAAPAPRRPERHGDLGTTAVGQLQRLRSRVYAEAPSVQTTGAGPSPRP